MAKHTAPPPAKHLPDFNAFVVTKKDADDKGFWTKIGAAWKHPDGDGLTLKLVALPTAGEIILRVPKPDTDD